MSKSKKYRIMVLLIEIIDVLIDTEYDVDDPSHARNISKIVYDSKGSKRASTEMPVTNLCVDDIVKR